jgi:hypothetical protein
VYVAVPPDRDEQPVRIFDTFTADLHEFDKRVDGVWYLHGGWRVRVCTGFRSTKSWKPMGSELVW